jgi:hypothetical protein
MGGEHRSQTAGKRSGRVRGFLGSLGGVAAAIAFGTVAAFGFWAATDHSNTNVAQAVADLVPQGATPSTPTTNTSNGNSVTISFAQATTTTGHVPITGYALKRYPAGGGAPTSVSTSCSSLAGTTTCTESSVPDGKWKYTDAPTIGTNWVGSDSGQSATVTVDTTAPAVAVTFPAANGSYNAAGWMNGAPIAGSATDATSGISGTGSINLIITQTSTTNTWNGTSFIGGTNTVHPTSYLSGTGGWTYNFASVSFPGNGAYTVAVTATDLAANTSAASTNTFKYDTVAPAVAVTFPAANGSYNAAGWTTGTPIAGTAIDVTSGVSGTSSISLTITQTSTGDTWKGTAFANGNHTVAPTTYNSSTGAWTYTFANTNFPADGSYTVAATATDAAGNTSGSSSNGFTYDTAAPSTATLSSNGSYNTAGWPGAITGTVSDSGTGSHGISAVKVSIQDSVSSQCWNGTDFTTAACPNYIAVTSGGTATGSNNATWSYSLASSALANGDTYTAQVQATDATTTGNTSGNLSAGTFKYDTSAPSTATLTSNGSYNTAGWPGAVTGTVSDSATGGSGISAVKVSIQDSVSGKCWNSTNFTTAACPNYIAVTSGGTATGSNNANWSYTLASSALTNGHTYTVQVQATDATTSGNTSGNLSAGTFTYDTTAPAVAVTFPAASGSYNVGGWTTGAPIAGTATDATSGVSGTSSINLTITQTASGFTWNGSSFVTGVHTVNPTTYNSGTGAWTYTFPNTNFPANGSYSVAVTATDAAGNTSGAASNGFKYDTVAPAVAVTFPAANGSYNAAGWSTIAGTATDVTSGITGASAINLIITQTAGGFTWNGSSFVSGVHTVNPTSYNSGTGAWTYTFPNTNFPADGTYSVASTATDAAGNTSSASSNGFVYDTTAPSSATLTSNGNYNSAGWPGAITGTVSDSTTGANGISAVKVSIQDSTSTKCWNGTNFTTTACPNYIAVTSGGTATGSNTATWSYTLASSALANGDTYTVQVQATDATTTGNASGNLSAGAFKYDTSAPSTAALASNGSYNTAGWPGAVTGTVSDSATGANGISAVKVSIQDSVSGKCWNSTNFTTAACPNYIAVTSGGTATGSNNANWSYTLASSALANGDTYTVQVQATDATTTGNASGNLPAGTFKYDNSAPSTATVTSNGAYNTAGWPGAITGTVSDSATGGSGISAVKVSIQDSVSSQCWNGTDFTTAACPNYIAVTSGGTATGSNNATWSYSLASSALANGDTYTAQVQATDATTTGNTSGNLSAGTFKYDTSAPSTATLTSNGSYNTAGWPGAVTGTVSDSATGGSGISAVKVSIQDSVSGKCWNSTNFTTAACPNYIAVTSGGTATGSNNANWSYTLASSALTNGHTYTVQVQATDATTSGNTSGNLSAGTFTYDTTAPAVAVTFPAASGSYNVGGWTTGAPIAGTATDATSGVSGTSSINLTITQTASGFTWNGSSFVTGVHTVNPTTYNSGTGAWTYTFPNTNFPANGSYSVAVTATDAAGNTSGAASNGFTYDTTAPSSATLTSNGSYNTAGWPGAVTGTVSDSASGGSGISAVKVSIQDSVSGLCWNGTNFTTTACPNYIAVTSGGTATGSNNASWSYTLASAALTNGHTYTVQVQATDATTTGNTSGNLAAGNFVYDTAAPAVAVTFPAANGSYNAAGWTTGAPIAGTATDATSGISGASSINLTITQTTGSKTWTGSAFAAGTNTVHPTSYNTGTGAWTYTFAAASFPADGSYTVAVAATDVAGNTSGASSNGFTYDTTAPSSATLTSNGSYNAAGWPAAVTGTVSDSGTGNSGISAVNVSIQDSGSGKCWNGTNFTTATCPNYIAVTSGGTATGSNNATWSYSLAAAALTTGHTYTVQVQAVDATTTGNASGNLAAGTFVYDTAAPSSATLTTNGDYNAAGWPGAVTGTVSDSGTGSSGISAVKVSIQDSGSGKCWNGTNFTTATCPNYIAVTSGGTATGANNATWSYTLASSVLTTGHTYTVQVQAVDATTTGNTSGNLAAGTFVYDSTAPTITSVTLTNGGSTAGQLEAGDTINVVLSEQMSVSSFCSAWSGDTADQSLAGNGNVVVTVTDGTGATNDSMTVSDSLCGTFNFGSINLGSNAYISGGNVTFSGSGANAGTITWTASTRTLTITLGKKGGSGTVATVSASTPIYTAAGAITDSAGNAIGNSPFTLANGKQF